MAANPNTVEPQFDWNEQAKTVEVRLDQDRIRALGLSTADVSNTLQALLSGVLIIAVISLFPGGIMGMLTQVWSWATRLVRRTPADPAPSAAEPESVSAA